MNKAHGLTTKSKDIPYRFGEMLKRKMNRERDGFHYDLRDLLSSLQGQASACFESIPEMSDAQQKMSHVNNSLDAAWQDTHLDYYSTEWYWDTEYYTDSEGNSQSRSV